MAERGPRSCGRRAGGGSSRPLLALGRAERGRRGRPCRSDASSSVQRSIHLAGTSSSSSSRSLAASPVVVVVDVLWRNEEGGGSIDCVSAVVSSVSWIVSLFDVCGELAGIDTGSLAVLIVSSLRCACVCVWRGSVVVVGRFAGSSEGEVHARLTLLLFLPPPPPDAQPLRGGGRELHSQAHKYWGISPFLSASSFPLLLLLSHRLVSRVSLAHIPALVVALRA